MSWLERYKLWEKKEFTTDNTDKRLTVEMLQFFRTNPTVD